MLEYMLKKITNNRGSVGIVGITVTLILLVIFPITAFLFEQARMGAIVGDVRKSIDSSIVESYSSLQAPFMSQEEFRADNGLFQFYVEEALKSNLNLAADFTPQQGSILSGPFTVNTLMFIGSNNLPYTDAATGKVYNRPFVELNFTIRVKPLLYFSLISEALGQDYKEITSVRKVTIPINN